MSEWIKHEKKSVKMPLMNALKCKDCSQHWELAKEYNSTSPGTIISVKMVVHNGFTVILFHKRAVVKWIYKPSHQSPVNWEMAL